MNDSGLTNRLPFLPAKKESWADPELSIGTFCGAANGKLRYWEAQGPAQEAYGRICTNIQDILNGSCGPVRCSSAIVYDIYMIGRAPATAVPHIMFSCKQRKSRKQAVSAVRASGILNGCPGFELGHWEYPPHIANIRLLADTSDGDSVCSSYSLTPIFDALDPSSTLALRLQETNCMANNPMAPRIATIGSTVKHNGQLFYVAPRHVFFNDEDLQQRPNNNAVPRRSKGDCEFGAFPDDDDVTDEEADFMSQYSASPSAAILTQTPTGARNQTQTRTSPSGPPVRFGEVSRGKLRPSHLQPARTLEASDCPVQSCQYWS
ncbi:uncharacterized protein BDV14DRAFT_170484 [Aspergillus stella-maris]|uniref:uncharacterized protein n=1 Tax=Aspergillus stella-maris TaxID=1810926 RepID=UPI003CCD5B33